MFVLMTWRATSISPYQEDLRGDEKAGAIMQGMAVQVDPWLIPVGSQIDPRLIPG
jgi:hypothetical protein